MALLPGKTKDIDILHWGGLEINVLNAEIVFMTLLKTKSTIWVEYIALVLVQQQTQDLAT